MIVTPKSSDAATKPSVRGWLRPEGQYVVLAVEWGPHGACYRLESEDNRTPALFEAEIFRLVDGRLSTSWIAVKKDDLPLQLMPQAWAEDGFWEALFDGDPNAHQSYEDAVLVMRAESKSSSEE